MSLTVKDVLFRLKNQELNLRKPGWHNKGDRGQALERLLGLDNSQKLTDLLDGELKTFKRKQTIALTQLKHCLEEIINNKVNFRNSKLRRKIERVIYVGFHEDTGGFIDYKFVDLNKDLVLASKLYEDFEDISIYIRNQYSENNQLKTFTGRNKLLQIRTKASKTKGYYPPLLYRGFKLKDKYMAFYLTSKFGIEIL